MNLLNIITTMFEYKYFPTIITITISFLVVTFIIVLFTGLKDAKKKEIKKVEIFEEKDITFEEPKEELIIQEAELKEEMEEREKELKQVFGEVTLHRYPTVLHFETAKEIVDYLEPVAKKLGVNIADGMPSFEKFLEAKYRESGEEFRIVRDGYLYVCRE